MNEDTQICVSLFLSGEEVKLLLLEKVIKSNFSGTDITKNLKTIINRLESS